MLTDDANWFAGLLDGAALFHIQRRTKGACTPVFLLALPLRDRQWVETLAAETGLGTVKRGKNGTCIWSIHRKGDCERLCDLIDRCPPLLGKRAEYEVWRQAVRCWVALSGARRRGYDWGPMNKYREELENIKYGGDKSGEIQANASV